MNLHATLFKLLEELLPVGATLVIGVSGGTDSLALLHLLVNLRKGLTIRLHVATLDHGLRGEDGAADARFVVQMAESWGVPVTVGYTDVAALARERRIGIEAAARIARYDFLAAVALEQYAARIAVAHNADDQVETVLMHLLRGAGVEGLVGMRPVAPVPGHPDLTLIRPLLDIPRADLEAYCREHNLHPRHDASNDSLNYARNRVRHELIPILRELSPQIERRLVQTADILRLEHEFMTAALHKQIDGKVERMDGRIVLPYKVSGGLDAALKRRFVVWAARELGVDDLGSDRILAAVHAMQHVRVGKQIQLKYGVRVRFDYSGVIVEQDDAPPAQVDDLPLLVAGAVIPVSIPGATAISDQWSLYAALEPDGERDARLMIPQNCEIFLRGRQAGDRFAPLGMGGKTQKVSEWMVDHKVPRHFRASVPLLIVNGEIAAICWQGWTISERFAVLADGTSGGAGIVYFRFTDTL